MTQLRYVKQESCENKLSRLLVRLDEGIENSSADYEADALTTVQKQE